MQTYLILCDGLRIRQQVRNPHQLFFIWMHLFDRNSLYPTIPYARLAWKVHTDNLSGYKLLQWEETSHFNILFQDCRKFG